MSYRTFYDENGDEVIELEEGQPWSLPPNYRGLEVCSTYRNIRNGAERSSLPVSRTTLHMAIQLVRTLTPGFGARFAKDPRPFSSLPHASHTRVPSGVA